MEEERRRYRRLPLKLPVLCQKVGVSVSSVYTGTTINVSPGGMLIEMNSGEFRDGEVISVEVSMPPSKELFEFGGSLSGYGKVLRGGKKTTTNEHALIRSIAIEFCQSPRFQG